MSQLEEFKKLYVKKKTYKIPKEPKEGEPQATIEVTPLSADQIDLAEVDENSSLAEQKEQTLKLLSVSLGNLPIEEIKKLSVRYLLELTEAIKDINNVKIDSLDKKSIKDIVEQKKQKLNEATK